MSTALANRRRIPRGPLLWDSPAVRDVASMFRELHFWLLRDLHHDGVNELPAPAGSVLSLWLLDTGSIEGGKMSLWAPLASSITTSKLSELWPPMAWWEPPDTAFELHEFHYDRASRVECGAGMTGLACLTGETLIEETPSRLDGDSSAFEFISPQANEAGSLPRRWACAAPLIAVLPSEADDGPAAEFHSLGTLRWEVGGLPRGRPLLDASLEQLCRGANSIAESLSMLPFEWVSIDGVDVDRTGLPRGVRRSKPAAMAWAVTRVLYRIAEREDESPRDAARQIVDVVNATGESGRTALVEMIGRRLSPWANRDFLPLVLAAEVVDFREDDERYRLRRTMLRLAPVPDFVADWLREVMPPRQRRSIEEALLSIMRKATSLTPPREVPETLAWLGQFLGYESSTVQQSAAQCIQNLYYSAPPDDRGEGERVGEPLFKLASDALREEGKLKPERASLVMSCVHALGAIGDPRFLDLMYQAVKRIPYVARLLRPRLESTLHRWGGAHSPESPAFEPLRKAVSMLGNIKTDG